jgi:hypothetical protein
MASSMHDHVRPVILLLEQDLRVVEVGVRVVALPDPVHREAKHVGRQALAGRRDRHGKSLGPFAPA